MALRENDILVALDFVTRYKKPGMKQFAVLESDDVLLYLLDSIHAYGVVVNRKTKKNSKHLTTTFHVPFLEEKIKLLVCYSQSSTHWIYNMCLMVYDKTMHQKQANHLMTYFSRMIQENELIDYHQVVTELMNLDVMQ